MATRLQIARARARVALARRTGESVSDEVLELSRIDLADAEKPAKDRDQAGLSEPSRDPRIDQPVVNPASDGPAQRKHVNVWTGSLHERLVDGIGIENDATIRTVEDIVSGPANGIDEFAVLPYHLRSSRIDRHEHEALGMNASWLRQGNPFVFTPGELGHEPRIGAGLFRRHPSETVRHLNLGLSIIVVHEGRVTPIGDVDGIPPAGSQQSKT
ncbi:hypothetical protein DEI99_000690 [Curtobacterium sp. MCLR17_036]|uniref:hypothetical protein n=1 Tax=Curtobacterium sp. MCLR17_036 TaxID=2175620 RepID=UPI0011B44650|nr:hypothetical protein [Curtobacterium sp. MCLR17_036]WIE65076.1 hypothetical protein DEI99_000690 [Curtobacterium sp. MCLR17_036]